MTSPSGGSIVLEMEGAATRTVRWFALVGVLSVHAAARAGDRSAAEIVSRHGGCSRAIPALESAYEDSGNSAILLQLARCHEANGDRDTAVVYYRRLADQAPEEPAGREARQELERLDAADRHTPATWRPGAGAPTRLERRSAPAPGPGAWGFRASLGPGLALPTGTYDDVARPSLLVNGRLGAERTRDGNGIGPGLRFGHVRWNLDDQFEQALAMRGTSTSGSTTHVGLDIRASVHGKRFITYASAGMGIDWNRWGNTDEDGRGLGLDLGVGADLKVGRRPALGVALVWHPATSDMVSVPNAVRVGYFAIQAVGSLY